MSTRIIRWVRGNLFSTVTSTVLTLVFVPLLAWLTYKLLEFVLVTARWEIVERNLQLLLVYRFPEDQFWRIWGVLVLIALAGGLAMGATATVRSEQIAEGRAQPLGKYATWQRALPLVLAVGVLLWFGGSATAVLPVLLIVAVLVGARLLGRRLPRRYARWPVVAAFASPLVAFIILDGAMSVDDWGGLMLTITLAIAGIALSFPLGVLFAIGRRSSLPIFRYFCIGYIEAVRGVPLVTLLFLGAFVIGLLLPPSMGRLTLVSRALIALVIFTSAYVAEIVRGGLQAVPPGQVEAADALGLSRLRTMWLIVLPQALRSVIPALVGQFISLFKDTSLVFIIGMSELLSVAQAITKQDDFAFQGLIFETLVFASFLYWVLSYTMSRESQRLERRLGVGER